MKIKYTSLLLLLLIVCVVSCKKEEIPFMDENYASVYFANVDILPTDTQSDSLEYSFVKGGAFKVRDTVYLKVRATGHIASIDRPVSVKQINTTATYAAVSGLHYLPLDAAEVTKNFVIPAGKEFGYLPIIVLRDQSVNLNMYTLDLELQENDTFKSLAIAEYKSFRLKITGLSTKPALWDMYWKNSLGAWGSVKMEFVSFVTGFSDWNFEESDRDNAYMDYIRNVSHTKLLEYNEKNPNSPLREAGEDGNPGDLVVI